MKNSHPSDDVTLPIHRVSTELGEGETELRHTVNCPAAQRMVDLDTCEACPHLERIQREETGPQALSCSPRRQSPPPSVGRMFDPLLSPLLAKARVGELMTRDVYCVGEELGAEELAKLFASRKVSGMPVVDENARLVGVVSRADLLRPSNEEEDEEDTPLLHPERTHATTTELMNIFPVVVHEDLSIPHAAAMMAAAHVHRVLVVSKDNTVVGILTTMDVVRWLARKAGYAV
jgi:CBS domain-containing protein